jgi:hypothetical protein
VRSWPVCRNVKIHMFFIRGSNFKQLTTTDKGIMIITNHNNSRTINFSTKIAGGTASIGYSYRWIEFDEW